ncbi:hypothetical protein DUI87_15498 [Hirundo rustica rustica]|uniref:Acylphosphatase n=1 Tax=Hirundo rustica rustica TaxID=333673 RepID=A0A3M0K498_HIRRU|nr:hypothetical protein DUI87_15498 [Hirundo rustica rustica]
MAALAKASGALKSVDYEVFGRVQGVCFRMYTEQEAKKLGVVGWVKNTSQGTVTGQVQGPEEKVNEMQKLENRAETARKMWQGPKSLPMPPILDRLKRKSWLSKVGSPSSRIDKTNFSNEKEISKLDFLDFNTRY